MLLGLPFQAELATKRMPNATATARICLKVALPVPMHLLFDYWTDDDRAPSADWIACRVRVPFGKRELVGWVSALGPVENPAGVKAIHARLDAKPFISPEWLQSARWIANYYQAPLGEVLSTAVPARLREGEALADTRLYAWQLNAEGQSQWQRLRAGSKRRALAEALQQPLSELQLQATWPGWRALVTDLQQRNWLERLVLASPAHNSGLASGPVLNADQAACVAALRAAPGFGVHVIEGVTGSGKTEVYLQAIHDCLARGQQALVLVPEIGLTPQTHARFQSRLPGKVEVLHSGLSDGDRLQAWSAMATGDARVLLGTRSAIFCSLPEAGLIIVDEEHDNSYKQQDGFHYHARDIAVLRAKALDIPVLLGSATPSLETLHNCQAGRYFKHRLPERAGMAQPPTIRITDVRKIRLQHGMSQALLDGIADCLKQGGQALVFKNRRGYAPALLCHDCGFTAMCPRCDSALTLHAGAKRLHCHHCGHQKAKPPACPDCGSLALQAQGFGTERLEEGLRAAFPEALCLRIDSETTRRRDGLAKQLAQLGDGPGILVGTQILAKGHDLPNLRFVAVVGVDESLYSSDFRAHEKLAQLLIQVAGRAGRSQHAGTVLIQTHHPDHPLLAELLHGGYQHFAENALREREQAELPPYRAMALLRCESVHQEAAREFLEQAECVLAAIRAQQKLNVHSSGALPAGMPRRAGRYRWQLILSTTQRTALQQVLKHSLTALHALPLARRVRWSVDVDPCDFL